MDSPLTALHENLRGKVAIITGASSGLGFATAIAFAAEGVATVVVARREDRLRELAARIEEHGGRCGVIAGDASLESTADAALRAALASFGRVDILVNNAGVGMYKAFADHTAEDFDALMAANVRSTFVFSRAVVPTMVQQRAGNIVIVSSVAGLQGAPNEAAYSATKFAQIGLAQSLDQELHPYGIKVCALAAGGMKTEFAVGQGRTAEKVAASRMMDPAEMAASIVFACMQPRNVRIPQMIVRHMGEPK